MALQKNKYPTTQKFYWAQYKWPLQKIDIKSAAPEVQLLKMSCWKLPMLFFGTVREAIFHGVLLVDFCVEKGWLKNTVWIEFLNWRFQRFLLLGIFWDDIVVQHLPLFGNKLSTKGVHEKPHEEKTTEQSPRKNELSATKVVWKYPPWN